MTPTVHELDAAEQYAADRNRLWLTATAALTAAAKLTHPTYGQLDFADFVADALAAVTANVGGVEELLAGRAGSWEAALVDQLIGGTLGYDPDDAELIRRRTEPVLVRLNVASLVDEHAAPGNGPHIDAMEALDARYDQASTEADHEALDLAAGELHRDWTRPLSGLRRPVHHRRARRGRAARRHRARHDRDKHRPRQRLRRTRQHRRPRLGRPAHRPARLAALAGRPRRPPIRRADRPT